MPIYEYRCRACGHELELIRKFSDPPLRKCRQCGGRLDKLVSRSAFHLKGDGWFEHGYGDSKKSGGGSGEKKKESASESKPKSESKDSTDKKNKKKTASGAKD